jgi:hypothetical protein
MNNYRCSASLKGRESNFDFEDSCDTEAIYFALYKVLDKATQSELWHLGEITLRNLNTNQIIQTMKKKEK